MTDEINVLGLNGGGSHTQAVILNPKGETLGQGKGGPANIRAVDQETVKESLTDAIQQALKSANIPADKLAGAALGLAGAGSQATIEIYRSLVTPLLPSVKTTITTDAKVTLVGALGDRRGLILIAGTGMIAYGEEDDGAVIRAGGWGTHIDEGSGYALGIAAIQAIGSETDGRGHATVLTGQALRELQLGTDGPYKLVSWLYDPERKPADVAALAPLVLSAAEEGDWVATEIVSKAADALADAAVSVYRRLQQQDETLLISYSGSLLTESKFYRQVVDEAIRTRLPETRLQKPHTEPVIGAAALAFKQLGISLIQPTETSSAEETLRASEQRNVLTMDIDLKSTLGITAAMHLADQQAVAAVRPQLPMIAEIIDQIAPRMQQGGRLIYAGSGTSGRLGALDALECPPTFGATPEQVVGIIPGGSTLIEGPNPGGEDDAEQGRQQIIDLDINPQDTVVGIAASGRTPYVIGVLEAAKEVGALTIAITCNWPATIAEPARYTIAPLVGPEILTGSTRLKAGTAQKLVLNMLSTGVMIRLGKTYGNLMVEVKQANYKLKKRAQRIVRQACNLSEEKALKLFKEGGEEVKTAIVMHLLDCSADEARQRLTKADGFIRRARN